MGDLGFKNGMKIELLNILTKLPLKRLEELKKEVEGKDRIVHLTVPPPIPFLPLSTATFPRIGRILTI